MPLALGEWVRHGDGHNTAVTGVPAIRLRGARRDFATGDSLVKVDAAQRAEIEVLAREVVDLLGIPPLLKPLVRIVGPFPRQNPEAGASVKGSGSVLRAIGVFQCGAFTPEWVVCITLLTGLD